ncbi:hypothetical protein NP493_188g01013 [Ridgeia piscesae]|uniref:GH18 domain-containing protein n=1 Tax=Ridgeia piscesae TaxID=27915 RepID=A0AAD9UEX2_RIDPI|nr:hypothetical protein NP493_188g01013 [Ridgeia piscesae]
MKVFTVILAVCLSVLVLSSSVSAGGPNYKRICYYTNWGQYRPKLGKFLPEDIDPTLCTHIIYAFGMLKHNKLKAFEWNDETKPWRVGMFDRVIALKKKNPALKVLLAVGGWTAGTKEMGKMLASAANRTAFTKQAISFLRTRKFDGLDLDFEFPGSRGSRRNDKFRFTLLCKGLKNAFIQEAAKRKLDRLLLTAAVSAAPKTIRRAYQVRNIARYLDFINLMAYDFHGAWDNRTGHNAPLFRRKKERGYKAQLNLSYAARFWKWFGCPPSKLIIGLGVYARGFRLKYADYYYGMNSQTVGASDAALYTQEKGFVAYYEICRMLYGKRKKKKKLARYWNKEQKVPYLVYGDQWYGYDDETSLAWKVYWLKKGGYGGWMVWSLDMDDFRGKFCNKGRYPLITAMNRMLLS